MRTNLPTVPLRTTLFLAGCLDHNTYAYFTSAAEAKNHARSLPGVAFVQSYARGSYMTGSKHIATYRNRGESTLLADGSGYDLA
jgi:hypothetical protein